MPVTPGRGDGAFPYLRFQLLGKGLCRQRGGQGAQQDQCSLRFPQFQRDGRFRPQGQRGGLGFGGSFLPVETVQVLYRFQDPAHGTPGLAADVGKEVLFTDEFPAGKEPCLFICVSIQGFQRIRRLLLLPAKLPERFLRV